MISFDEAVGLVGSVAKPLGTETVSITEAAGRVLARSVIANIDSPRSDVSSMDGYAVRDEDLRGLPISLQLAGVSYAGGGWEGSVKSGTCVRIFTGAPVPNGADRVVIQELVRPAADVAVIDEHPGPARHIRRRGSDFVKGDQLLSTGRLLDPRAIVVAAAADVAEVEAYLRPKLKILTTGDELADPGTAGQRADAVPESVSFGVAAIARHWGAGSVTIERLRDDLASMMRVVEAAIADVDLIVVTGGASVGERDFAKAMFDPLGMELVFSKVSIKPGKPVWLGRVGTKIVMGLPGNPTSALVTARLLFVPLLAGLTGRRIASALSWRRIPLTTQLEPGGARETFHRARSADDRAEILSFQDSSAQKALAEADLLVRQRANSPALEAGADVEVLDF